jgi:hypothetical protein
MSALPNASKSKSSRIHPLVAAAAFLVIAACGTGVAAFTGLLPASKSVASEVTAMPLVDMQIAASGKSQDPSSSSGRNAVVVEAATHIYHRPASTHEYVVGEASLSPSATPTISAIDVQVGKPEPVSGESLLPS